MEEESPVTSTTGSISGTTPESLSQDPEAEDEHEINEEVLGFIRKISSVDSCNNYVAYPSCNLFHVFLLHSLNMPVHHATPDALARR